MIYISYSEHDISSANFLNQMLKRKNYLTWMVHDKMLAGEKIEDEIEKTIEKCDCFVFCIGKDVISSNQEFELMIAKEKHVKIIPVLFPNNGLTIDHEILRTHVYVDFRKAFKNKDEVTRLYNIINGDFDVEKKPLTDNNIIANTNPKQTRKAVNVALIKEGKILIVQRAETQKTGSELWQLPGGKVEDLEDTHQTAIREIKEEIGIDIYSKDLIYVRDFVDRWFIDASEDYFVMSLFICHVDRIPLDVHDEFKSYKWIPMQDMFEDKTIIYFGSTSKYLQYIRRFILTHLPLNEIGNHIKQNFKKPQPLPKKLSGISEESTLIIYSFLSLLGFISEKGDFFPASTLSHQLVNLLSEWALTDGVIFEAIESSSNNVNTSRRDNPVAVAKFREGLFDHHSNLLGILSYKLPKALSTRKVASLLIFGRTQRTDEVLFLVRWDFLANKYQIPSKGLEGVETDIKDIETAKYVVSERFKLEMIDLFEYQYFMKTETQHIGEGSLSLLEGDGPMLRHYFISFFKLKPKKNTSQKINEIIDEVNRSTIDYLKTVDDISSISQDTKRNLHFYSWVSLNQILRDPDKIIGEVFQGFADLLDNTSPDHIVKDIIEIDVIPQSHTPITTENDELDHLIELREQYATRFS